MRLLLYAVPAVLLGVMAASISQVDLDRWIANAVEEVLFAALPIGVLQRLIHVYVLARSAAVSSVWRSRTTKTIVVGANPKSGKVLSLKLGVDAALYNKVPVSFIESDYARPFSQAGYFEMRLLDVPASPGVKLVTPFERVELFDKCVWITRDILATLVSHYTYILDGGENQILEATRQVKSMPLEEGVKFVFEHVSKPRMEADKVNFDAYYKGRCLEIGLEDFRTNWTSAIESFVVQGMGLPLDDELRDRLEAHDTLRTASKHSSTASPELKRRIRDVITRDPEMARWLASMS